MKKIILSLLVASSMFAFGCSSSGEGGGNSSYIPPIKISSLVTTGRTTFAIATDGKLYAWGRNNNGQVGNGSMGNYANQTTPYEVTSVGKVKSLEIGGSRVYAITEDGKLYAWGYNRYGGVGNGRSGDYEYQTTPYELRSIVGKVKSLEISGSTVYAITEEGKLYAWGYNYYGEVGNGSTSDQATPYELTSIVGKVKSVVTNGLYTVYAITEEGKLYAWGMNAHGQVGNGSTGTQTIPYEVTSVGKVKSLETNGYTVYAITEEGKLYAWGNNYHGQVGNGSSGGNVTTPYEVTSVGKVKSLEVYYYDDYYVRSTVYVVTEDGKLYAWGYNYYGQVGNGKSGENELQSTPYEVTSVVGKVKSLKISGSTVYAITEEGKLYVWGNNGSGQVGNGSTGTQTKPYEVTSIVGKVKSVVTNGYYTVYAITEEGKLYAWGDNEYGQVGNGKIGENELQSTPYEVTSVGKVKSLEVYGFYYDSTVYTITEEGKLYAWGRNDRGQVGNGSSGNYVTTPYEVTSVGKVKSVISGSTAGKSESNETSGSTVYAITEEGKLYAWGHNYYGQVGNGSYDTVTTPYYISEVKQFLE